MTRSFFTKDRVIGIVSALVICPLVAFFPSSLAVTLAYWTTWGFISISSLFVGIGAFFLLERSERTVLYTTELMKRQIRKKKGFFGSLLDHVPSGSIAASWILTSNIWLGGALTILWIASVIIITTAEGIFYSFDEETRKELLEKL